MIEFLSISLLLALVCVIASHGAASRRKKVHVPSPVVTRRALRQHRR